MSQVDSAVLPDRWCRSRQRIFTGCLALALLIAVTATRAAEPLHYRVVSARQVDKLECRLREVAAKGYRLIGSCTGTPMFRSRGVIHLLLERVPSNSVPPEYVVVAGTGWLVSLKEAGERGFLVPENGVIERPRQFWLPLPPGAIDYEWMQTVIVMERREPSLRAEYAVELPPHTTGEWPALASRVADGYRIVAATDREGVILARRAGADRPKEIGPDPFTMISSLTRKKVFAKLEASAEIGFRLVAQFYGVSRGGSLDLLLQQVAEPGRGYEYRMLPGGKKSIAAMNELGAEGFRLHRAAAGFMERDPVDRISYEYQLLEVGSTDDLNEAMEEQVAKGYRLRAFLSRHRILMERTKEADLFPQD